METQVAVWKQPFSADSIAPFGAPERASAAAGTVLLVRVGACPPADGGDEGARIQALVRGLRRRCPGSPLAVWIPEATPDRVIDLVRAATASQVRAILGGPAVDPDRLRCQLTHPLGLSAFVLRWACDAGYLPPGMEPEDVRGLLDAAPDVRTLERLALHRHVAARTWRSRLQQLGLPTPRAWLGLAHALHVAFFMQRNHADSLQALCEKLGMHTVANLSQQFRRVFGLSPSHVRDLLGAEPLLHRWFQARCRR